MSTPAAATIRVAGHRLETTDLPGVNERRPLVLLHEGLGSVGLWRRFPGQLQRITGRRTIAFSRYGHGRSDPPANPRTPKFFHEEALDVLPELLEHFGAEAPILVGHSDGASIALIYAAHHPVSAVVLLAPHVFVEDVTIREIRATREAYRFGQLRERMARHHDDPDAAFWGWCNVWLDSRFRNWTLDAEAQRLTAPTLLIQGANDPYGSLAQLDRIQHRAPASVERLVLPGGHSPHLEHETKVVFEVNAFLSRAAPLRPTEPLGWTDRRFASSEAPRRAGGHRG